MAISPPRALMLIIYITCATFADSYVITKDNHTTADDDYDYGDDPFTVHHVDELDAYVKYYTQIEMCHHMTAFLNVFGNIHNIVDRLESGANGQNAVFCEITSPHLECFNKTFASGFPEDILGNREVEYEVIKLFIKNKIGEQLRQAKLNFEHQFGDESSYPLEIDIDQCESLHPSMDVDEVPAKELCTIRQLTEMAETESSCYDEHISAAKLKFSMQGGPNRNRTYQERFACEQVEDYMNKCLAANLNLCYEEESGEYLRRLLFDGHHFKDQLSKTVTHVEYYEDFWYNCRRKGYFGTDEIHSLSYFVEHERPLNSTNGTVSGNRNGIDELFEKLTKALGIELTPVASKTEEKVPVPDRTFHGLNAPAIIGICFAVLMLVICIMIFALAIRERKTGGQLCSWCPAIRIPWCHGWCGSTDIPYRASIDDNVPMN